MIGAHPFILIVLAGQHAPQTPVRPQTSLSGSLAARLPDATVFFRCPDSEATDRAWKDLAISKLFLDPEVKEFLGTNPEFAKLYANDPFAFIKLRLSEGAPEFPMQIFSDLATLTAVGESAFAVRTRPDANDPEIYATMGLGPSTGTFDKVVDRVFEWLKTQSDVVAKKVSVDGMSFIEVGNPEEPQRVHLGRRGSTACFSAPTRAGMLRLLGPPGEKSLADSPNFTEADANLTQRAGSMYLYLDGPSVLAHLEQENGARHSLRAMGIEKMRWAGLTFEPEGEYMRHRIELRTDGANSVLELFSTKESFELEKFAPTNSVFFVQAAIDGKRIVKGIQKMNALYNKQAKGADDYAKAMSWMRSAYGTDIDEISTLIGDEAALAVAMPVSSLIPDAYLLVRAAGVDQATQLASVIENAVRRVGQSPLAET